MHDDYEISSRLKAWGAIVAVALVLIAGIGYYATDRAKTRERLRLEEARIAAEAAVRQKAAEAEEGEVQEPVRGVQGAQTRVGRSRRDKSGSGYYRSQDETDSYESQRRQYDDQGASQDRANEARERYQAEADRQRAQGDVERQKRYVQQREEEEEAARNRRHDRVQQEERERAAGEAVPATPDTSTPLDPRVRKK
jgi:hypothetical protein